jgi:Uma2 family endonuclease
MSAKVLLDVDEYLATAFEDADCEYLDGELVERNVGELPHSTVQRVLILLLSRLRPLLGIRVQPEIRIRIHPRRYRVADIAVWRGDDIGVRIPTVPPFLAIEILSPEDRVVRMLPKIQEYLSIGVEYVWLIDPEERAALIFSQQDQRGVASDVLRTANPDIEIPLAAVLDPNA